MPEWCRREADGSLVVHVHAQPGARRTEIAGMHGDALKIRVMAPALEDRANLALMEVLAAHFKVPANNVTLMSGAKSRQKRFRILP